MRNKLILFGLFFALLFAVSLIVASETQARVGCPQGQNDFGDECEDVTPQDPIGSPSVYSKVVLTWGCSSNGSDRTCNFSYNFSGASQVYRFDYVNKRNDDPTPRVYWCINDTNAWGTGRCGTIQDDNTGNIRSAPGGINDDSDASRIRYFMVRMNVDQTFTNSNDFVGEFTVYRRELLVNSFTPAPTPISNGSARPKAYWSAEHSSNGSGNRIMFWENPAGGGGAWDIPESSGTDGWEIPMDTGILGQHNFDLKLSGPGRNGPTSIENEFSVQVVNGSTTASSTPGRYKCLSSSSCGWVSGPSEAGLPDQCSIATAVADCGGTKYKCSGSSCVQDNTNGTYTSSDCNNACGGSSGGYECQNNACVWNAGRSSNACNGDSDCLVADDYCANFIGQNVSTTMTKNRPYPVSITMKNCGNNTWTFGNDYKLGAQNPQDNSIWLPSARVDVPPGTTVPRNQQFTFNFNVTSPSVAGNYDFQWRMVREFVRWFGDYTPNLSINVVNPVVTHMGCVSGACQAINGAGTDDCVACDGVHNACISNTCIIVANEGGNACSSIGGTCGCGNGVVDAGEACDDGGNNGSCPKTCGNTCQINTCGGTVSGRVYLDANGNGVRDGGEGGYAGATVALRDRPDTTTIVSTTSDGGGNYALAGSGSILIKLFVPSGYAATTASSQPIDLNSNMTIDFGIRLNQYSVCEAGSCVTKTGIGTGNCSSNANCNHSECREIIQGSYIANVCTQLPTPGTNSCNLSPNNCAPIERCLLSVSPDRLVIPPTATTTLSYTCQQANCSLSPAAMSNPVMGFGTLLAAPTSTTTYTLTCNTTRSTMTATAKVRVYNFSGGKLIEINPGGN